MLSSRGPDLKQILQTAVSAGQMDSSKRGTYHLQSGQGGLVEQLAVGACTARVYIEGPLPCLQLIGARLTDDHQVHPADRVRSRQLRKRFSVADLETEVSTMGLQAHKALACREGLSSHHLLSSNRIDRLRNSEYCKFSIASWHSAIQNVMPVRLRSLQVMGTVLKLLLGRASCLARCACFGSRTTYAVAPVCANSPG